jgi:hypothetical protein
LTAGFGFIPGTKESLTHPEENKISINIQIVPAIIGELIHLL